MAIVLSRKDLRELLTMSDTIDAVEQGFREYRRGHSLVPVRMPVPIDKEEGLFLFMPAYLETEDRFGTKMISVFPRNPLHGLATLQAVYILNDPTTGRFLSIMDGIYITAMRTGAASAVATKHLARQDTSVLGIIGTGAQAPFQVEAVSLVRPIQKVLAFDRKKERAQGFVREISSRLNVSAEVASTPRQVVRHSDVLITVTTSHDPVFDGNDLRPGTHINAVGAYTPDMRELDDATVQKARIVVDTYEGCMAEAGDLLIPLRAGQLSKERIEADLGEIVLGEKSGRLADEEITVFESVGFALEDLVTASLAYQRAVERGEGLGFDFGESD